MRRLVLILILLLAALPAAAQTLRIALREDPDALDPTLARTYVSRIVFAGLCDKLFDIDESLRIVPQLAASYEWTSPTELVIHLRDGVLFHDGTRMDAAAVKYSLERHLTLPGSFRRGEIGAMERVEVVDPLTVRITLKSPSSPFLAQLADRAGMIVSPAAAQSAGKAFGAHPVCAGPFRFVERVPQDRIVLERFPQYWDAAAIHLDRVIYLPIPDSSVRLANLEAGSIEMSENITATDVETVRKNPKLRLVASDSLGYQTIAFNVGNGPQAEAPVGASALVRQAFELGLDREALTQVVYNGLLVPAGQAAPAGSPFYIAAIRPPGRDVARARALLKQAGLTPPVPVRLTVPNNPDLRQVGEIIQSMEAEAGFEVKLTAAEYASALSAASRGEFEAFLTAWSGRIDPDGNLYSFLHSGAPLNDGHYARPEVDALLEKARAVADVAARRTIYAEMYAITLKDLPILYLWQQKNLVGMQARVRGFRPVSDGMIRLQGVSLTP